MPIQYPEWKRVPKPALVDAIRNTSGIPRPTTLSRQDKVDLIAMVETVWPTWSDDARAQFLQILAVETDYQHTKRQRAISLR